MANMIKFNIAWFAGRNLLSVSWGRLKCTLSFYLPSFTDCFSVVWSISRRSQRAALNAHHKTAAEHSSLQFSPSHPVCAPQGAGGCCSSWQVWCPALFSWSCSAALCAPAAWRPWSWNWETWREAGERLTGCMTFPRSERMIGCTSLKIINSRA